MLENITRRTAAKVIALGMSTILYGCSDMMSSPTGSSGYGNEYSSSSQSSGLPQVQLTDPVSQYVDNTKKLFFFRMDGTYMGKIEYKRVQDESKEPKYTRKQLTAMGMKLDEKVDLFYMIREEPLEGKPGKIIIKATEFSKEKHELEVPAKKPMEKQWYGYFMDKKYADDDKAFLNANRKVADAAEKKAAEEKEAAEEKLPAEAPLTNQ